MKPNENKILSRDSTTYIENGKTTTTFFRFLVITIIVFIIFYVVYVELESILLSRITPSFF